MNSKIKVAFIGAGKISEEHIKAFKKNKKIITVAIYSRTKSKAKKLANKYKIRNVCNSISEMYFNFKPDLVVISVSVISTLEVCLEVSKFPWKCLVEKPFGYNLKECKILNKSINKNQFYIALNRRNYQSTIECLRILKKDNSTRIIQINDQQNILILKNKFPIKVLRNYHFANSVHLVDYINIFARGKIVSIKKIFDLKKKNTKKFFKKISFSSGDLVIFKSLWNMPGPWGVSINTKKLYLEMKPLEKLEYKYKNKNKTYEIKTSSSEINFKPGFIEQAKQMIKVVNKAKSNLPTSDDIFLTTKLIKKLF